MRSIRIALVFTLVYAGRFSTDASPHSSDTRATGATVPANERASGGANAEVQSWRTPPPAPPADGAITKAYSDLLRRSEWTLHLWPHWREAGRHPVTLVFAVEFPGRELKRSPVSIQVRAQSSLLDHPSRLRQARLMFELDDRVLDLTAPGRTYVLNFPCGPASDTPCAFDGVRATLDGVEFLRLAHAVAIEGDALGFPFELERGQLERLREFARQVHPR